jgi:enamine deaminase RidA (YjgF/YER057c/UK114 family)
MTAGPQRLFDVYDADPTVLCPLGVRVDDLVYGAGLEGLEAGGGIAQQFEAAMSKARTLLQRAEAGVDYTVIITCYVPAPAHRDAIEELWVGAVADWKYKPRLDIRPAQLLDGELCRLEVLADGGRGEASQLNPLSLDGGADLPPLGARLGPIVYAPAITAADQESGRIATESREKQIRGALENMDRFLEAAGIGRGQVARVAFYMNDVVNRDDLHRVWEEWYPDAADRPPHIYLPVALPPGCEVMVQVVAVAQGVRRVIEVPGIRHGDPMSMAALTGQLITSSRVMAGRDGPRNDSVAEWTRACFENIGTLLRRGGAGWPDVTQLTAYLSDPAFGEVVEREWRSRVPEGSGRLEIRQSFLGRDLLLPRLLVLAVKPDGSA